MPARIDIDVSAFVEDYSAGKTLEQIGAKHGVSANLVWKRIVAAGVTIRRRIRNRKRVAVDVNQLVVEYVTDGLPLMAIAKKHGLGFRVVRDRLDELGYVRIYAPDHPNAQCGGYVL